MIDLLIALIDKFLWVGFVFSILGLLRVVYLFWNNLRKPEPQQLVLPKKEIIAIGLYIAVIIMCVFTGIKL